MPSHRLRWLDKPLVLSNEATTCGDAEIKETGTQTNTIDRVPVDNTHTHLHA